MLAVGPGLLVTAAAAGSGSGLAGDWAATEMRTEEEEEVWTLGGGRTLNTGSGADQATPGPQGTDIHFFKVESIIKREITLIDITIHFIDIVC